MGEVAATRVSYLSKANNVFLSAGNLDRLLMTLAESSTVLGLDLEPEFISAIILDTSL